MLADVLGQATGRRFDAAPAAEVQGGSINTCVRWHTDAGPVFVKIAPAAQRAMFEAEAAGLRELDAARAVRVPQVLAVVADESQSALALEWLDFGSVTQPAEIQLGRQLAAMHRSIGAQFGWSRDNTIGRTPQPNAPLSDWPRFYAERRLGFQLDLAEGDGLDPSVIARGRRLAAECSAFFTSYRPVPSLLHGDLWGGNWGVERASGVPVLFDPAVHYGDREADLAMTRLFGGFGPDFYAAYEDTWPLDAGAGQRRALYDLYHVLNHHHLFGGGYARQAAGLIDRLLAEL